MASKYAHLRAKARELRQKGYTLTDIIDMLKMPRSTIYGWIQDIEVEIQKTEHRTEAQKAGTKAMQEKFAALRDQAYQQGMAEAPELLKDYSFRDFVVLYLAEGSKKHRNQVAIANSDVTVMKLAYAWLVRYGKDASKLDYYVQMHIDHDEDEVKQYWAYALNIDPTKIKTMRKSNSGQLKGRKFNSQYGVLSIQLGDTYLRARLEAWMDYLRKQWVDAKFDNS